MSERTITPRHTTPGPRPSGSGGRLSPATRKLLSVLASVVLAILISVAYLLIDEWLASDDQPHEPDSIAVADDLLELVDTLTVRKEAPMDGYNRDAFRHWDLNRPEHGFGAEYEHYSRCTSRDVMLLRDAVGPVTLDPQSCTFTIGADGGWRDEYGFIDRKTGELRPYKWMTAPSDVDAEHIVALAEAWRSWAARFDDDTRRRIANDALNLAASDPSANRSKGDLDAGNYLPPGTFRCTYVDRYLRVKVKYGLTVDTAEHSALRTAAEDCITRGGTG
ncbi:MAG: HNH endonuclease [Rhodococcus sp.]|nr:HNH endonuclease [Rhodococcus sp. (in: high G+C Gram-positive bacteria)]